MQTREEIIAQVARQTGFSTSAVAHMWDSLSMSNGSMAQFNHPEFGGMGQWMAGGMMMIGDMFNNQLKGNVAALCDFLGPQVVEYNNRPKPKNEKVASSATTGWWPERYLSPAAVGAQNNMRYAYFPDQRRLVVEINGLQEIYDTGAHQLGGFSQQNGALQFSSQLGSLTLKDLTVVAE